LWACMDFGNNNFPNKLEPQKILNIMLEIILVQYNQAVYINPLI